MLTLTHWLSEWVTLITSRASCDAKYTWSSKFLYLGDHYTYTQHNYPSSQISPALAEQFWQKEGLVKKRNCHCHHCHWLEVFDIYSETLCIIIMWWFFPSEALCALCLITNSIIISKCLPPALLELSLLQQGLSCLHHSLRMFNNNNNKIIKKKTINVTITITKTKDSNTNHHCIFVSPVSFPVASFIASCTPIRNIVINNNNNNNNRHHDTYYNKKITKQFLLVPFSVASFIASSASMKAEADLFFLFFIFSAKLMMIMMMIMIHNYEYDCDYDYHDHDYDDHWYAHDIVVAPFNPLGEPELDLGLVELLCLGHHVGEALASCIPIVAWW